MGKPTVLHLVDDASAGGVTRMLRYMASCQRMAASAHHEVEVIPRGKFRTRRIPADLVVSHLSLSWRTLPSIASLRLSCGDTRFLHVEHSYSGAFEHERVPNPRRFRTMLKTGFRLFHGVVAVSKGQADWIRTSNLLSPEKLRVIPSTVDVTEFSAIAPHTGPIRTIGAMGRFDPQKGFDVLIKALRACPDTDILVRMIGDGPEMASLRALAENDPRIEFTGFLDDPAAAMSDIDAVAMPSRWEPYGLVALEARAAGRLLLASTVDGLQDHIEDGALAVTPNDVTGWANQLRTLPDLNRTDLIARGREAALDAERRFADAWDDTIAAYATR